MYTDIVLLGLDLNGSFDYRKNLHAIIYMLILLVIVNTFNSIFNSLLLSKEFSISHNIYDF